MLWKVKLTSDVVAVMEVSQSSFGVRTRAKTLALQKLQALKIATAPPPEHDGELSYLQLPSRRLEKPPLQQSTYQHAIGNKTLTLAWVVRDRQFIRAVCVQTGPGSSNEKVRGSGESQIEADGETEAYCDLGSEETSFGENNIDFDGRKRPLFMYKGNSCS